MVDDAGEECLPPPGGAVSVVYVYLCAGRVEEFPDCPEISWTDEAIILLGREEPLARFRRRDVYLVARERLSTPVLF